MATAALSIARAAAGSRGGLRAAGSRKCAAGVAELDPELSGMPPLGWHGLRHDVAESRGHRREVSVGPGGREYLGRVPGVATSPLSNADLAELVNWMLWRFDRQNLPATFEPYTAAEIGRLRAQPLRLEASQMRSDLLNKALASGPP